MVWRIKRDSYAKISPLSKGTSPTTAVASHPDLYPEGKMIFKRMVEHFGVGVVFEAPTNPPIEPNQTAKITDPTNPKAIFITATNMMKKSKQREPLDVATGLVTPVKIGIVTFKDQGQTLYY